MSNPLSALDHFSQTERILRDQGTPATLPVCYQISAGHEAGLSPNDTACSIIREA